MKIFALGLSLVALGCSDASDPGGMMDAPGGASGSVAGASSAVAGASPGGASNAGNGGQSAGSVGVAGARAGAGGATDGGTAGSAGMAGTSSGAGAAGIAGAAGGGSLPPVRVYLAGDSTVSQYVLDPKNPKSWAGWGQMLGALFDSKATVTDAAVGGRTARRFIQEGLLAGILKNLSTGDYLFVQFGTNDSNTSATYTFEGANYPYFAAADSDFKTYLKPYIDGARGRHAIPVLVTPPPRNSAYCKGGRSLANYGKAMLDLGAAESVPVIDLGLATHAYLTAICPKPTTAAAETFFKINADQSIDGTHFQENGARIMAGFVADGVSTAKLGLSAYRK